jgi:hypothetical protein
MRWTRGEFEEDRKRYQQQLDQLLTLYPEEHPLVTRQRRRIATVDLVLSDPRYGLTEEVPDGPADHAADR